MLTLPETLPWYKSKIIVGGLLAAIGSLLSGFGVIPQQSGDDITQIADVVVDVITVGGALLAVGSRLTQKAAPPITATK